MTPRLYARVNSAFKRYCPEQRLFLKSDAGTRFIRLRPITIAAVIGGSGVFVAWTILVTSIFLIDTISSGNAREQVGVIDEAAKLIDALHQQSVRFGRQHGGIVGCIETVTNPWVFGRREIAQRIVQYVGGNLRAASAATTG